jgi:glucose-6-phosphate isomerase
MPRATERSAGDGLPADDRVARLTCSLHVSCGTLAPFAAARRADATGAARGLWRRDPATWSPDPAVQSRIAHRLGWLGVPSVMAPQIGRTEVFADQVRRSGFTDVVLLGMGGSSLAPEVLRLVLGSSPGWPRLHVLDSTDPAAVRAAATPPPTTLYLLASKSGTTIEPNVLAAHFRGVLEAAGISSWGSHFVAITDADTALAHRARDDGFRDLFINPSDVGGRYSALSFFGLVPAALLGQDIRALLSWGSAMLDAADPARDAAVNPAVELGLVIGAAARTGRDKLVLSIPPAFEPFGLWVEQLVAESTGKNGVGVVPVVNEAPSARKRGDGDRLYVELRPAWLTGGVRHSRDAADRRAPVVSIDVLEPAAIGAEFVRWEVATAVAGALVGINPFDEPNVQQAKEATRVLLDDHRGSGQLPRPPADRHGADGVIVTLTPAARSRLGAADPDVILTLLGPGDYFGLLAYVDPDPELARVLEAFRLAVGERTGAAATTGIGPRYLHSTGQLHKGGANNGVFVLVTATPSVDVAIPGETFSFGTLELAQALGDFGALSASARRGLHVHLPAPDAPRLAAVFDRLLASLPRL